MSTQPWMNGWKHAALLLVLLQCFSPLHAQAPTPPPISGVLTFTVTDGNCSPATVTINAGRIAIVAKLSSTKSQKIALITTDTNKRHLFEHDQSGASEDWMSSVMLPAGSYELVSSLHGNKCSVTAN